MPSPDPISLGWGGTIGRLTEGLEWAGTPQQFKEEVVSGSFSSWRVRIGERKVRKDCALFSLNNNERGRRKVANTFTELLVCTRCWVSQTLSHSIYKILLIHPNPPPNALFTLPPAAPGASAGEADLHGACGQGPPGLGLSVGSS